MNNIKSPDGWLVVAIFGCIATVFFSVVLIRYIIANRALLREKGINFAIISLLFYVIVMTYFQFQAYITFYLFPELTEWILIFAYLSLLSEASLITLLGVFFYLLVRKKKVHQKISEVFYCAQSLSRSFSRPFCLRRVGFVPRTNRWRPVWETGPTLNGKTGKRKLSSQVI